MFCRIIIGSCLRYFHGGTKETALVGVLGETLGATVDAKYEKKERNDFHEMR